LTFLSLLEKKPEIEKEGRSKPKRKTTSRGEEERKETAGANAWISYSTFIPHRVRGCVGRGGGGFEMTRGQERKRRGKKRDRYLLLSFALRYRGKEMMQISPKRKKKKGNLRPRR